MTTSPPLSASQQFVFVDRILETEPGKRACGIKNVSYNEAVVQAHFPDPTVMPCVLIIEALAQVARVALPNAESTSAQGRPPLVSVRNMKFYKAVIPGDQLRMTAELTGRTDNAVQFQVKAEVNGDVVAEGEIGLG